MPEIVDQGIPETKWLPLAIIGIVLILLSGFNTTLPTWTNYLYIVFLPGGVVALILAVLEFNKTQDSSSQ